MFVLVLIIAIASLAKRSTRTDGTVDSSRLPGTEGSNQAAATAAAAEISVGGSSSEASITDGNNVVEGGETEDSRLAALEAKHDALAVVLDALSSEHNTLASNHDALEKNYSTLQERYELLEASAAYSINGTTVAFRSEVHVGDLVLDLTAGSDSLAALLSDSYLSAEEITVVGDKKVVIGWVRIIGTNVSVATLSTLLAKLELVEKDLVFDASLTFAEGEGAVQLASLLKVGGSLDVYVFAGMPSLALPSLLKVGGSLNVIGGAGMSSLALPSVLEVSGPRCCPLYV